MGRYALARLFGPAAEQDVRHQGFRCFGCRGYIDNPNVTAAKDVIEKYGLNVEDLKSKMVLFGSKQRPTDE